VRTYVPEKLGIRFGVVRNGGCFFEGRRAVVVLQLEVGVDVPGKAVEENALRGPGGKREQNHKS